MTKKTKSSKALELKTKKHVTKDDLNSLISDTLHRRTVVDLVKGVHISPKQTEVINQIGNLVEVKTSLGNMICTTGELVGILQAYESDNVTLWAFYKFFQIQPKTWQQAQYLIDSAIRHAAFEGTTEDLKTQLQEAGLLEAEPQKEKLLSKIASAIARFWK